MASKIRETIPDLITTLRRAHISADAINKQLCRIKQAQGMPEAPRLEPIEDDAPRDPTPKPEHKDLIPELEGMATTLADDLSRIQESLTEQLNYLFGDCA